MNWSLIAWVTGACLVFTVWWQNDTIGGLRQDLRTAEDRNTELAEANGALLTHIEALGRLEEKLNEFDANQRKRTQQLKNDLQKSMADDGCAPLPVPADTLRMQREDIQRANDEIRAMYHP